MEILLSFFIGTALGIITGIIPGIHSNLAATAIAAFIGTKLSDERIAVLIISMGVAHSITDNLPSIFLGMPDTEKIMSALPSHKMLFNGKGMDALILSVAGTLFGTIVSIALLPLTVLLFSFIYWKIKWAMAYILLILLTMLIMGQEKKFVSLLVILFTGIFGIAVFRTNINEPLLPMLSGLFGVSALALTVKNKNKLPKQNLECQKLSKNELLKPSLISVIFGIFSAFLPGFGPSQIAALASKSIKNITERGYIVLSSALSTTNLIAGIAAFYAIGKSRNGIIVAIQNLIENVSIYETFLIASSSLGAAGIAAIVTILIAKSIALNLPKINYSRLCIIVIIFISIVVLFISGFFGLFVLFTATSIGIVAVSKNIARHNMMGCIILPVLLFFIGINL